MNSIYEKFKTVVNHFRLTEGKRWHEQCNIFLIKSLSSIEKGEFGCFYNELISNGFLKDNNGDYYLTKKGELLVYGEENDPTFKIFQELFRLDMGENSCWQFQAYNSFKASLNPVEEKAFCSTIKNLISEGIFELNDFDNMLIVTKKGEEKIKELFYK